MTFVTIPDQSVRTIRLDPPAIRHARHRSARSLLAWAVLLALGPAPASALSLRTLTLEELVHHSRTIFVGRCVAVREAESAWAGLPATEAEFSVTELVKADAATCGRCDRTSAGKVREAAGSRAQRVRVRQISASAVPGIEARFRVGQEVLLFLHGDGVTGLTSPVGMAQGVFTIVRAGAGHGSDLAIRGYGSPRATSVVALPQRTLDASGGPGASGGVAVDLDALLGAVRRLVEERR